MELGLIPSPLYLHIFSNYFHEASLFQISEVNQTIWQTREKPFGQSLLNPVIVTIHNQTSVLISFL